MSNFTGIKNTYDFNWLFFLQTHDTEGKAFVLKAKFAASLKLTGKSVASVEKVTN